MPVEFKTKEKKGAVVPSAKVAKVAPSAEAIHAEQKTNLGLLADTFGGLKHKIDVILNDPELVEAQKALKEVDTEIQVLAGALYAEGEKGTVAGDKFILNVSAMKKSSSIPDQAHKEKVLKLLGDANFMAACTIQITALRKYLTEEELEQVLVTEYSGKRTLKVIEK